MAEFDIRVKNIKKGNDSPVSQAIVLLKTFIAREAIIYELDLALTEAVANVIRHAYPGKKDGPLAINIHIVQGQSVTITLTDKGQSLCDKLLDATLPKPSAEHGRGIPLMTSLCDRVEFHCNDGVNKVTMIKSIAANAWRSR